MNIQRSRSPLLIALSGMATSSFLVAALDAQAAVTQSPLSLTVGVPPNLILTLDDSGSMRWAFVPDSANNTGATRRAKSPDFNPMYYDPKATYKIPPRFNTDGSPSASPFTTSFTNAYNNGFDTSRGSYNLSNDYRVSWSYDPTSTLPSNTQYGYSNTANRFAQNPTPDYNFSISLNWTGTGTSAPYTVNNVVFTVTRTNSGSRCTVNISSPTTYTTASCSRSSNTYTIATNNTTQAGVPAYYYLFDTSQPSCTTTIANQTTDDNCYRRIQVSSTSGVLRANDPDVGTDERQNFANWYSFYRNRALATVSAASIAFSELPTSTRLTWQGLTTCATPNTSSSCNGGDNLFREYSQAQRGRLFNWMQDLGFPGGTPLRAALNRAGNFLTTDTAWQNFPNANGNNASNTYACRPSYHILMTDGVWNGANGTPAATLRADHSNFNLPDGVNYNNTRALYSDATTNTLADLAMHYWATDLKTNLDNRLKPFITDKSGTELQNYWNPRNNPASWQHMVNFTISLGLTAALKQNGLEWDPALGTFGGTGYTNLANGTRDWPAAEADSANNVYDLWHTAINSRGEFFSADSPESVVQAFSDIMSRIADRKSVAAKPAVNSGQLVEDVVDGTRVITVSYQTSYASDDNWSGDLKRSEKERVFNSVTGLYEDKFTNIWNAKDKLPAEAGRNITMKSNTTSGLQAFTWGNAGDTSTPGSLAYLLSRDPENGNVIDTKGEARLDYLRGRRTGEGTTFRTRGESVLGDLYSSSPAVVSGPRYLVGFADRLEGNTAYSTFFQSLILSPRPPRVYVGGNDGMLHGFNAKTGVEEFAFVPTAVFAKLNKLTGKNYSHEFYVDGSPTVADVYDGTQWRTILVGTLRAGGKGLFALDITTPGSEKLLWEFDDNSIPAANNVKMGYSFAQPTIARLHTGKWGVVFGNGYESANHLNGKAALFVVDAFSGELLKSLEVSGEVDTANGLSTPKLSDFNNDGVADYAYAGDIQGNLWRFNLIRDGRDLSDLDPLTKNDDGPSALDDFKVSYGAKPMFKTVASSVNKTQPITSAPSLILHPSGVGYLVIFGTGKYYEDTDKDGDKSIAQSVYGIWDRNTRGEVTNEITILRNSLAVQDIETQIIGVDTATSTTSPARTISSDDVQWLDADGNIVKNGWVLDLQVGSALDGEMVVENMAILGRTIFFQSLTPNDDPCADGAGNWTYAINPFTGGATAHHVFDVKDVTDPGKPAIVSAVKQDGEGGLTVSQKPDSSFEICTGQICANVSPDPSSIGRQSWRPIEEQ